MSRDETAGLRAAQLRLGRLPGYVRRPDPARRSGEKGHTYKKGWEVRFTARSEAEIAEIRDLVVAAGFAPARPFFKGHQLIQPVYGMAAVQAYLTARQLAEEHAARAALGRQRRTAHEGAAGPAGEAGHEREAGPGHEAGTAHPCEREEAAARLARRAVESFPAQVERGTAVDDLAPPVPAEPSAAPAKARTTS
ncbi:hypothetical protein ACPC54_22575 [Kitasatospora sp. NPDC094028]